MRDGSTNRLPSSGDTRLPDQRWSYAHAWRGRLTAVGVLLGVSALLALGMRLPQELVELNHNQERIRALQEENNNLKKYRDERLERLKNLKENFGEQELMIRKNLNLVKPGDTVYLVQPKGSPAPKVSEPESN